LLARHRTAARISVLLVARHKLDLAHAVLLVPARARSLFGYYLGYPTKNFFGSS
jgi:hypothetical protein